MASEQMVELPRPELSAAKRAFIEARLRGQVRSSGIVPRDHRDGAPLSFAQERLWFIHQLEPGSAVYNSPMAWRLGALDEAALERALGEIVRRHEALRTTFREVDGSPVQVIAPFVGFALPVEDLSGLGEADREAALGRRVGEEALQPFDLSAGPLFRAALLRLGAEDHVLLLSMHHIVSDAWSMGVLSREFSVLYAAYREGRASPLPELAVQYADYAVWQREQLEGKALDRQLAYWRERLAGAPELLDLPTDRPRPPVQTYRGATVPVELSLELQERLQALGRSEGATLFMTLLGAFQVLLGRYAGSEDVVVGTPIAGRTRREVEELIGFFVNTLVLRTQFGGDPSFREVLRRVREATLGAYEHQEVPFEKLVAELQPERSLSHSPLVQVLFAVQNSEGGEEAVAGLEVSGVGTAATEIARFDLSLTLSTTAQGLRGALNYSTDLFERGTVDRMLGHLARVLEQVAADADVRLSQLELLGEAERALVLNEWNRTDAEYPAGACIHELFEAQAARTPGVVALRCEEESLTYAELNARANRLAHHLRGRGVGPEVRVGVLMERSPEMVVSLLAVLKAGGAYVPLDPGLPAERLAYMLEDSAVPLVLAQAALRGAVPEHDGVAVLAVDALVERLEAEPAENPAVGAGPDSLAYVIYTSGSTGRPKGVMNAHRGVVNRLVWMQAQFGIGADDVVLQKTPFGFDVSVWEFFWPLQQGARLVMARPDGHRDPAYLREVIEREGVTTLHFVPSMLQTFVEAVEAGRCGSLRHVVCSGEALPPALVRRFYDRFAGPVVLTNLYGPTEAAVDVSCWTCPRDAAADVVPIGRPVWNTALYVLDAALRPAPLGAPGELYIGGVQVARGYQGRAAMTAERFGPDPFSAQGGARLYRTGDRARWRTETTSAEVRECGSALDSHEGQRTPALPHSRTGVLEYLGRLDFQVKVRGFRIELGEIEAVLHQHESVGDCVVMARAETGETRLVAYVVGEAEAEALRAHVRRSLPEYMLPSAFVFLDAFPLTANGKLDRKALPAPELASAEDRYVAPRTPLEEVLAGIWAEVLRLERAGVTESFFDLGGHSLLATRVVSRIRDVFGVELSLRALFEGPTVAEMAGRVEEMRRAGEGAALPPLVPVAREAPLPLSFAQERLWFLHQMDPEGAGYHMPWPGRLRGCLDAGALERALGALTERHESLRTTFRPVEQGAVQIVHPPAPANLPVLDLTELAPRDREVEARRLAREDAERPFDLERGPLLRATLVRLSDEEHVLLLTMHHIVSDGWSMGVLFRELFTLYESLSGPSGAASPLAPLAVQYADFAVWQRGWLQGDVLQRQLDWWRERLGGAPPALELPTDRPRPAVASPRGGSHLFRLPPETTGGLRSLARREGATLYMVTHAALDLLLSRWSGQEDLVVGSPIAGRTQVGTEGLIGFFVNTLALRIDLSGDPSFQELVRRVRETALGAYAHQELPFERLVEEVAPERGLSHTPLFQVMFAVQNADAGEGSASAGVRLEPFASEIRTVRFDLELDLREVGEELVGSLRFRSDLFDATTIERFAAQYQTLLGAVCAAPEERLSRLAILPAEEARTLLAYGNGPAREDAGVVPVHRLFAEQAARTPQVPAVLFAGESLTYAELDARAECLARRLRGLGVGVGTAVAACLERGPGVLVALLAVWKAGGVYLPLDPSYPAERLSFLLRDSGASHVLTEPGVADVLPKDRAEIVLMGGPSLPPAPSPLAEEEEHGLASETDGNDLAYLIYTSGSTGTPKAVMVEHGQLAHTLSGALEVLGLGANDVVTALASVAFDISLLEMLAPLLAGGTVRIVPHEVARDPEALVEAVRDVSVLHAVPALMRQVVEVARGGRMLPSLRLLLVGGDSVPPDLLEDMREVFPAARTRVLYGPTEGTIICATYAVPAEGVIAGHPLGRPLPGVRLAVRGPRGEMAPVGVPGEVWISGGGVARGYFGRPELNAEKFVGAGAERAYRTGDRARWRADGVLEFLGRADEQVKVRGFRIEPGEVEAVLREQPGVREAVVLAREDAPGDRRLVAYVVPGADGIEIAGGGREQVSEWETLFDDTYAQDEGNEDPTLQLKGWNSSYTGEPIPREEMRAWAEHTAERILALRTERVLEVGCGTGLLLFRVAPHTRAYHGTDFSGVALEHVRRHAAGLPQVTLSEGEADELAEFAGAGFDLVVVNSVAQYFPDLDYLLRVLEGAAAALRPGGRIFIGDVRSLPLAGAFHASVELARAPEDLSIDRLQARVRRGMAEEQELLLDPALFEALRARLPRLGRVEVQVKRGEYDNEVSRFRYDVVLYLDVAAAVSAPIVREWSGEDADGLRALAAETGLALLVRGVPDARVREHVRVLELISSAAAAGEVRKLAAAEAGGIAPAALFALADELARGIEVRPGAAGTLDVLFHPAADVARFPAAVDAERPWESYANDPQWGRRMRALVPALREAARARLPEYMVPSAFMVLEALPVTANGKVDRAALPAPDTLGSRGSTYVAPRTPAEERMAAIWAEVLGAERVGGEDNFFELGGHSLLATQLVSRVREAFQTELPLRAVFEAPTLAELTRRVEALLAEAPGDAGAPPLLPVPRDGSPLPLSFAQERLWFIDQMEPGSATYNLPAALRLEGAMDERALERALGEIVRRHEALRTVFAEVDGSPVQVIAPFGGFALPVEDLSGLGETDREAALRHRAGEHARRAFDLSAGPLFRAALLRMDAEDHVLLLSMHHIVSDGWSMGVLYRELSVLYAAYREGRESPLAELAVQYGDYAAWQREQLKGEVLDRQLSYWKERLAGAPELLELPTDHPRPAVQTFRGATVPVELSLELLERLQALGRSEGTTLFMTLLGAFQVLLSKYGGSEDVVVGSPIAGRTRAEVEELIGFFVNTLVLRTDMSGDPSFRETLRRVREVTLGAYAHQEVPFEKLVAELQPERSLSYSPLFQVMFTLQNADGQGGALPGLEASGVGAAMEIAKFDLSLTLTPTPQGLRGGLDYSTDLFQRGTIVRMLGHLARVLEQVAADADVRLSRLELLGEAERALVLEEWNATAAADPGEPFVHELFAAQAARTPEAVAVRCGEDVLTYRELDARANGLARHLAGLGAGPEVRVGVCLERGPELVTAILAVLKAGATYLPLDPSYPADRLAYMLEDSGAPLLVTQASLRGLLPAEGVRTVVVDPDAAAVASEPDEAPRTAVAPENAAYVIYTSGSTGRPKGVVVTHANAANLLPRAVRTFGAEPGGAVLQTASMSFDASLVEVFVALLSGAALHMAEREVVLSPDRLGALLREREIGVWVSTPALLDSLPETQFPALHTISTGGERCSAETAARWSRGRRLINMYGPTETTIYTTAHACAPGVAEAPPIGRPVANARAYVLDAWGQPVPIGVSGELHVGGAGVARGYLGRAALTAERFVPDALSGIPGARLYRTGDRARWRTETTSADVRECATALDSREGQRTPALPHSRTGVLEFLGRTDAQVKIRGIRIEPGEVESALLALPSVREAVVVAREAPSAVAGDRRLVGYVVAAPGETLSPAATREQLRARLPEHMVPSAVVELDTLPLTPSGKLDRKALPEPEHAADADRYVAPRTPVEEVLAGIWAEVLRLEQVGVEESFFELGGHSLLATRVVSRVRDVFAIELPLRALFERPTVAELAGRVEEMRRAGLPLLPPVVPVERAGPLPLSFAQERLWFIDRLEPGSAAYNLPVAWHLGGALDEAALERALGEIVRRHEALRTTFGEVDGSPVQVIAPFGGFALPVEDLSALTGADRGAALRRRLEDEARQAFDLSAGPLFRAALLRLGAEEHVLLLSMHHVVSDGWSMGVLSREFSALYAAYREGRASPLPELAVQYADYAVWQREQLAGEVLDRQLAYWRERLAGAPELLELPTDHPRPPVQTYRGATVPVELSLDLLERLQALGRSEGTTLFMTLLGAFQVLLSKYSGSDDVVVGTPIAGRTRKEVEELIGFFVNTLVLRTDLGGDPSFREVLGRVREVTLGAYENQEVPFERLVAELQPERSLSHSPVFQVMFALENSEGRGSALPGLDVSGVGAELASAKFDLSLTLAATPQGLRGGLNYSTDVFGRGAVQRMVGHLHRVLEQVALDADVHLSMLELLAADEREQVLGTWNHTARETSDPPAHALFAEWARRAPEAVALLGREAVTYGALDRRAAVLARHLRDLGVGPETPVGLCMERTPELLVGVLGIWKAGGAYVPLDPGYPAERLGWIISDAALPVVVATADAAGALPEHGATLVRVDQLAETGAEEAPEVPVSDAGLAYVIYTSGSTGRPKGVLVQHGSLSNLLAATREAFGVGEGDVMPALASYAFDIWLFEALLPLTSGAALRLVERERVLDVTALLEEIKDATLVHAVPALMRQLVQAERETPRLGQLRRAFVGGDRVAADLLAQMREALPGAESHVLYGPTEGTILASTHAVPEDGIVAGHPIGRPLGNVRLYVCGALGSPLPAGVPGELLIGGAGVARGYQRRASTTAERFVPDPFGREPGARLYRTGDRVRRRTDGSLEYLGRLDEQVKIRGFRIEPGEIEAVLSSHAEVREARVIAREDQPGETRLVAYVVGGGEAEELREHLRKSVPEYMVPAAFVVLPQLPLTPNGKLDRKALPAPERVSREASYTAPRRPLEAALAGIWAEVLGRARVGVKENFFDLGGHSLLLVKVQARLREALDRKVPIVDFFRFPTVAALAEHLGGGVEEAGGPRAGAEGRRRRGRDRAAVRRAALAGQGAGGNG